MALGSHTYYSNGKLLLTGEYVVLDGALSLALPSIYGQYLTVTKIAPKKIIWKSLDKENSVWFKATIQHTILRAIISCYDKKEMEDNIDIHNGIETSSDKEITAKLLKILVAAQKLNSSFLQDTHGYEITTKLTFPRNWGLGSSSTLINNIAQWAKVDAYALLFNSFPGSGYDIACARHRYPVMYRLKAKKPIVKHAVFYPSFAAKLYFIHLNKKQDSSAGISLYHTTKGDITHVAKAISAITQKIESTSRLSEFETLVEAHENHIADLIKLPKIKTQLFNDYPGKIKSLGAWGGDFILATGNEETPTYFKDKGFNTVIAYDKMVLNPR